MWQLLFPPVRFFGRALFRMRLEGREHIPKSGGYIIVANHTDWKDPPVIELSFGVCIRFMAKIEAFSIFFLGGLMRGKGCFPVRRGESDRRALTTSLQVLKSGNPLGFFPEGTRSRDGVLHRGHPGIAFLARRSGAQILPVGLSGTHQARPLRSNITVRVGEPFRVDDLGLPAGVSDQETTDAIMRRIARVLPPQMRGEYAD
jgi:1-acyl-sn-glycerol-3-phosphate acyltransferase